MYIPNYLEVQRLQQEEEDSKADLQEHRWPSLHSLDSMYCIVPSLQSLDHSQLTDPGAAAVLQTTA